jgi:hypothetical protein
MRKILLLPLIFVLLTHITSYCQTVDIVPGQSEINFLLGETGKSGSSVIQPVQIKVVYQAPKPTANANYIVTFGIINQTTGIAALSLNPKITNSPFGGYIINNNAFKAKPDTATFTVNIETDATTKLTGAESFDIKITTAGAGSSVHRVLITTESTVEAEKKKKQSQENPFETGAISIGHSFDFFGKSNALISYADAFIFKPNSIRIGKDAPAYKYGFAVKIYQNKSITIDSLNSIGVPFKLITQSLLNPFQPPVNDSVLLKQEALARKASYTSTNWGMSLRLFRDISYKNEKVKFYLGLHGEFLRRDIKTTYEYKTEKDTVIKVKTSELSFPNVTPVEKKSVQSEFYIAPYAEFLYVDDNIKTYFSLIPVGLHLFKNSVLDNLTEGKCFWLGQFDMVIRKINLKIGAECRGLYNDRAQPYWNVFISKAFSWDKIAELFFDK